MDVKKPLHEEHNIGTTRIFVILQYKLHVSILNTGIKLFLHRTHPVELCFNQGNNKILVEHNLYKRTEDCTIFSVLIYFATVVRQ